MKIDHRCRSPSSSRFHYGVPAAFPDIQSTLVDPAFLLSALPVLCVSRLPFRASLALQAALLPLLRQKA